MLKDYKQIPTVDFKVEATNDTGPVYSDFSESSGDEPGKTNGAFDFEESIPTGELDS